MIKTYFYWNMKQKGLKLNNNSFHIIGMIKIEEMLNRYLQKSLMNIHWEE